MKVENNYNEKHKPKHYVAVVDVRIINVMLVLMLLFNMEIHFCLLSRTTDDLNYNYVMY